VQDDLSSLLSEQALTPAELEEIGRRLTLLREARPSLRQHLREAGVQKRREVLEEEVRILGSGGLQSYLSNRVGWRDFYSLRFAKARILNSIRSCGGELDGVADRREAERILARYDGLFVPELLPYSRILVCR